MIAPTPTGVDFEAAKQLGLRVTHALGLPAKTAPETAGKIVADTVETMLAEHFALGGDGNA